jgi:amino acid adenylation domain-containing protein
LWLKEAGKLIKNVAEYLETTAKRIPGKTAFADEKNSITFSDLRKQSRSIATAFAQRGLFKKPILVALEKSIRPVPVFLGAAYSGNFYVPLDVEMPPERVKKIIDTLRPGAIVTDNKITELLKSAEADDSIILQIDEIIDTDIDEALLADAGDRQIDSDILYVLFTSGSTGTPKGVCITHRSVISYSEFVAEKFKMDENVVFGQAAQFTFDTTIRNIYQTIRNGGTDHIIPKNYLGFPVKSIDFLNERKINTIFWTPTLLGIVAKSRILQKRCPEYITRVIFSGEMMPCSTLNAWRDALPNATFLNVYGQTEVGDTCSYYVLERRFEGNDAIPIGYHDKNVDVFLLNDDGKLCQIGEKGEICVRSSKISPGYYNDIERTKEVFVQNPLNKSYAELIYRSGDIGYYNDLGELILVGRKDFQIKHSGYRIELGEIESRAEIITGVSLCACIYDKDKQQILLFYTGEADEKFVKAELRNGLQSYMVPHRIKRLETMPTMASGKIDRQKLA